MDWFDFHNRTKIDKFLKRKKKSPLSWIEISFKYYQRFPRFPLVLHGSSSGLEKVINDRRTGRDNDKFFSERILARIIINSMGINFIGDNPRTDSRRRYPSAGSRYPVEVYLMIRGTTEKCLRPGLYHFSTITNELELLDEEPNWVKWSKIFNQSFIGCSAVTIVLTSVEDRLQDKYGNRGYRYALIECGHIAQNVSLLAEENGISCCCVCGFKDDELHNALKIIDPQEVPLYVISLGLKR